MKKWRGGVGEEKLQWNGITCNIIILEIDRWHGLLQPVEYPALWFENR